MIKEIENMLLSGLGDVMTEVEREFVVSMLISACPDKLSQAAELMATITEVGYTRGLSFITAENPSNRKSIKEEQQWKNAHPLPIRMPRAYSVPLDFDPYSNWGSNLSFLDDYESFRAFHATSEHKVMRDNISIFDHLN